MLNLEWSNMFTGYATIQHKGLNIGVPFLFVCLIVSGLSSEKPAKIPDYCICTSMIHREVIVESTTPILSVQKGKSLMCYF